MVAYSRMKAWFHQLLSVFDILVSCCCLSSLISSSAMHAGYGGFVIIWKMLQNDLTVFVVLLLSPSASGLMLSSCDEIQELVLSLPTSVLRQRPRERFDEDFAMDKYQVVHPDFLRCMKNR